MNASCAANVRLLDCLSVASPKGSKCGQTFTKTAPNLPQVIQKHFDAIYKPLIEIYPNATIKFNQQQFPLDLFVVPILYLFLQDKFL